MRSRGVAIVWCSLLIGSYPSPAARAEGHGPMFGLATPTLARGQWSSDTAAALFADDAGSADAFREMLGYGLTEDLQANLAFPLGQHNKSMMGAARMGSMMGSARDVEASLQWRFHRVAPEIGARRESALIVGISESADSQFRGINLGNAINLAAVTGFASRVTYWWLGAGVRHRFERGDEQLGSLYYASAVFGWRPALFRQDYPKPDWRVFIEGLFEKAERDRVHGDAVMNSGGESVLLGPSFLGLYGRWGVEAGALWPVSQSLDGNHRKERYRAKFVFTYWF